MRAIRDAGLLATSGYGHAGILRTPEVIEEIVRFTASDVEPRVPTELQPRIDRDLFVPDTRRYEQRADANWG